MRLDFSYTEDDLDEWFRSKKPPVAGAKNLRAGLLGWVVFVVLAVFLIQLIRTWNDVPTAGDGVLGQGFWDGLLASYVPWVVIFLVIWAVIFRQMRNAGRNMWRTNEDWRQPHVATIDAGSVEVAGPKSVTRFLWTAYAAWYETERLFVLCQPLGTYTIVPKRAAGEDEQNDLRAAFNAHIGSATGGFPVVPAPPPPPPRPC